MTARRAHVSGVGFGFSQFVIFAVYALAFWYGGILISQGRMDLGQVLKVCVLPPSSLAHAAAASLHATQNWACVHSHTERADSLLAAM